MSEIRVTIRTDNAAFEDHPADELGAILDGLVEKFDEGEDHGTLRDSNGNTVGSWAYEVDA